MIITGTALKTLGTSFNALFSSGLGMVAAQRDAIATTVPSTTSTNEYAWLGALPNMREWLGDRQVQQLKGHGYSVENKDFELTVEVLRKHIEDDNIGSYNMRFKAMGQSVAAHPEQLCWSLLANGHNTLCYDGQFFFDTDHPVLDAGGAQQSVSNSLAGAGTPWFLIDDSQVVKPIIYQERKPATFVARDNPEDPNVFDRGAFKYGVDYRGNVGFGFWQFAVRSQAVPNAAGYEAARTAMMNITGDYGRKIGARPKLIVAPTSMEAAFLELLKAERNAAGATNIWKDSARLLLVDWL